VKPADWVHVGAILYLRPWHKADEGATCLLKYVRAVVDDEYVVFRYWEYEKWQYNVRTLCEMRQACEGGFYEYRGEEAE